jgi:hypothetical protein
MKCVAEQPCQVRLDDGSIRTFDKGEVWEFETVPPNFRSLEDILEGIDFETAGEAELLESEYDLDELKDFILKKFKKKAGGRGKEKTVEFLIDCRYRDLSTTDLNKVL